MKWFLRKITNGLTAVTTYLGAAGALGLFAIAFIDSALIPLPGVTDAVFMMLAAENPERLPLYMLAGIAGSTGGCVLLYYISRKAGSRALDKFSPAKRNRVEKWLERYDVMSVLVAAILPPPFPFKLFVIMSGVFRLNVVHFAIAVAIGRTFRFGLEAWLAIRYGDQAKAILELYYPYIGLGVAAIIIVFFVVKNLLRRRNAAAVAESS